MFWNPNNLVLVFFSLCVVQNSFSFDIDKYRKTIEILLSDPKYQKDFDNIIQGLLEEDPYYFDYKPSLNFDCNITNLLGDAKTVHELKPNDIKVVSAFGDSITAGVGEKARTVIGLLIEFRQDSWSIGGSGSIDSVLTLPNIIKKFNPNLVGFSTRPSFALTTKTGVGFNVAVSGNKAIHLIDQAKVLIKRLKANTEINFQNDWKLVTIFIGGNDLCQLCEDKQKHSPENFINNIKEALDLLQNELPKTFVNLVNAVNVADIKDMNDGLVVSLLHKAMCDCGAFPKSEQAEKDLFEYFEQYSNFTEKLVSSGRYDTKDDFSVVYQPFLRDFKAPRKPNGQVDRTYFAPDRFHFSSKSHALAARGLWNSMLEPVGKKATTLKLEDKIKCPTQENPYFFTNKNSEKYRK